VSNSKSPVVISGVGVVAPQALGCLEYLEQILLPEVRHGASERFDSSGFSCSEVGELRGFSPLDYLKKKKTLKLMGENITYAVAAAKMAAEGALLTEESCAPERLGVVLGGRTRITDFPELQKCVCSSIAFDGSLDYRCYGLEGMHHVYPLSMLRNLPNMASAHLSIIYGALGPTDAITNGATSTLQSVGEGVRTIERGDADIVITGGCDSLVSLLDFAQLASLGVILKQRDHSFKNFDVNSHGGFPGEGASIFVIETLDHCLARGAKPVAYVDGFAEGFEPAFAYGSDVVSNVWTRAIQKAGYTPADIKAVSLAGSGYAKWEKVESEIYRKTFGDNGPLSWSSRAHSGLAGAVISGFDLAAALLSASNDIVPVTSNCSEVAEYARDLNLVINKHVEGVAGPRLVSSHNRAGAVAALVIRSYEQGK
jgi:3-oxoacyl-[acyl-carrier-protein] synthase II